MVDNEAKRGPLTCLREFKARLAGKIGLRGKLLLALLPPIILVLLVAGYASSRVTAEFIDIALARTVRMHTLAISHEVEGFLDRCRTDLLALAQSRPDNETLRTAMTGRLAVGDDRWFELAWVPASGGEPTVLVQEEGKVRPLSRADMVMMQPSPLLALDDLDGLAPGQVRLSPVEETVFPLPSPQAANRVVRTHVIRLRTLVSDADGTPLGVLSLAVKAARIRNILSLYNSQNSPLWSFQRSNELRFSYLLDANGWILFQSGPADDPDADLATFLAREGVTGTLGRQGYGAAFRPNENQTLYWKTMASINQGEHGLELVEEDPQNGSAVASHFHAHAPVRFAAMPGQPPEIFGGVVFVDRSQLPIVAGYRYLDVMLFVTIGAILFLSVVVWWFGRILTKPIRMLAARMGELSSLESLEEIELPYSGYDMTVLQDSINAIIRRVKEQVLELKAKDEAISNVNRRERASMNREMEILSEAELSRIPEIVGQGSAIASLKTDILKAAQVDVDVLITGDTGTGKQLVAEAVHGHSERGDKPLVSINCGALDENLLLDALFGHVKGAFSEARADRNGAFVEADGGTLFLDEIQSASPKVQQSLLRAVATRKIKPLGSDKEVSVNVRIIAATNVDMPSLIENGRFREDLYYRLKVISIATPRLREHPENIPLLGLYYLRQAEHLAGRSGLGFSKGALAKLTAHSWPGNVRELVNSITRAAVMAETEVIQAEEIRLEGQDVPPTIVPTPTQDRPDTPARPTPDEPAPTDRPKTKRPVSADETRQAHLSDRQNKVWPELRKRRTVTRKEYQELAGGDLPTRTAIYDLQDFVKRGLLRKRGRGPSTRYEVQTRE